MSDKKPEPKDPIMEQVLSLLHAAAALAQANGIVFASFIDGAEAVTEVSAIPTGPSASFAIGVCGFRCCGDLNRFTKLIAPLYVPQPKQESLFDDRNTPG